MTKTALVYDDLFLKHKNGEKHPECPERLEFISRMLNETGIIQELLLPEPRDATRGEITAVHTPEHYEFVKSTKGIDFTSIDSDTSANRYSFDAALRGSGGFISSLDGISKGDFSNAFTLPRPPGHHAERDRAMGFCLFNHVAVGAAYLLSQGYKRILIVDWDVHHGNGTQDIFYDRSDVLYFSTHQFPFYPGTGSLNETGSGKGKGYTVNVPMAARMNDEDYITVFNSILTPVADQYDPDFILVSAGFDSYFLDPLGGMEVTENGFAAMTRFIMKEADNHCNGRVAFVLEGGYNIQGLYTIMQSVFEEMLDKNKTVIDNPECSPGCEMAVESVIETYSAYWDF